MNRPEVYKRSIDVLSRAYLEGTLMHSHCYACAIGNLVCAALGDRINGSFRWEKIEPEWTMVHMVPSWVQENRNQVLNQFSLPPHKLATAIKQLEATGYTTEETARIEAAFESEYTPENDPDGYLGLLAVVDELDRIHEVNDPEITEQSRKRFVKEVAV